MKRLLFSQTSADHNPVRQVWKSWWHQVLSTDLFHIYAQVRQSYCSRISIKPNGHMNKTQKWDASYLREGIVSEGVNKDSIKF